MVGDTNTAQRPSALSGTFFVLSFPTAMAAPLVVFAEPAGNNAQLACGVLSGRLSKEAEGHWCCCYDQSPQQ